jgi:hypothetical protein
MAGVMTNGEGVNPSVGWERPGQRASLFTILAFGVALGLLIAYVVSNFHVITGGSGPHNQGVNLQADKPVAVTPAQLSYYEKSVGHDVYWLGPRSGFVYELTETAAHDTYLRYLPAGVAVGSHPRDYTVIGTYPAPNAYVAVRASARDRGQATRPVPYSGLASWSARHPTSVYLAYPHLPYLVEIYNPLPATARSLALSGALEPVRAGS